MKDESESGSGDEAGSRSKLHQSGASQIGTNLSRPNQSNAKRGVGGSTGITLVLLKVFLWFAPLVWIAYLVFRPAGLGAEPFDLLNKRFGDITIYLLLANLYIGHLVFFYRPLPRRLVVLVKVRRSLGVACFCYAILHVTCYVLKEGSLSYAWGEVATKTYLLAGAGTLFILFVMALTSNDYSIRKLRPRNWRWIHRLVYVAVFLASIHQVLIEKADIRWAKIYFVPLAVLYGARVVVAALRARRKTGTVGRSTTKP